MLTVPFMLLSVATFSDMGSAVDRDEVFCSVKEEKLGECHGSSVAEEKFTAWNARFIMSSAY